MQRFTALSRALLLLLAISTDAIEETQTSAKVDGSARRREQNSINTKKPNILLILADDVGTGDIPYYWKDSGVDMPNLDRLSSMGVTFTDAHATPLCAPSRYMLLSGNYPHRGVAPQGSWGLSGQDQNQFLSGQRSIAEVLKEEAGYSTAMFGKWHLGAGVPRSSSSSVNKTHLLSDPRHDWSQPLIDGPQDIGFDTSLISVSGIQRDPYAFFRNGYLEIDPSEAILWDGGSYPMPHGISMIQKGKYRGEGDKDWDSSAYNMILVNETIKFVDNHLDSGKEDPFFAYVALGAVHTPHSPPYRYLNGEKVAGVYPDTHMDMLYEMDLVVGSLVSLIEDKGLAEDTIIIFASDNGGLGDMHGTPSDVHDSSGPLRGSKAMIYEGGHRIPMIIRHDKSFPPNEERSHLVGLNDLYATLLDLVGVAVPNLSAQDSMSFSDYIFSGSNTNGLREELATFAFQFGSFFGEAIRSGSLKLIHNLLTSTFELYDLNTDLRETTNLVQDVRYANKVQEMYTRLVETGPCPKDKPGSFTLKATGQSANCDWFRSSTSRCDEHIEGKLYCNSVCANSNNRKLCSTAVYPLDVSLPRCQDKKKKFKLDRKMKPCKYLASRPDVCYEKNLIRQMCQVSCKEPCTPYDKEGSFKFKGARRTCKWVGNKKINRCKHWKLAQYCPVLCG